MWECRAVCVFYGKVPRSRPQLVLPFYGCKCMHFRNKISTISLYKCMHLYRNLCYLRQLWNFGIFWHTNSAAMIGYCLLRHLTTSRLHVGFRYLRFTRLETLQAFSFRFFKLAFKTLALDRALRTSKRFFISKDLIRFTCRECFIAADATWRGLASGFNK